MCTHDCIEQVHVMVEVVRYVLMILHTALHINEAQSQHPMGSATCMRFSTTPLK
jgi:Ser-tRNA(Ala) deacylase AlaX